MDNVINNLKRRLSKTSAKNSSNVRKKHFFDPIPQYSQESKARIAASYQLLIVKENKDGSYSVYDESNKNLELEFTVTEYPYLYKVFIKDPQSENIFEFPITPQMMSVTTPYAIESFAASNGVVEEHAGLYFKQINLVGTFGINPGRPSFADKFNKSATASNNFLGLASTLFSNTLNRARELKSQFNRLVQSLPFNLGAKNKNINKPSSFSKKDLGTGYYYALALDKFLEQYAIKKAQLGDKNKIRLALYLPKFGYAYLVTPISYTYSQSAESPLEYKFNLQLKAYKRIALKSKSVINPIAKLTRKELNDLQKIYVSLNRARMALSVAYDVVKAVRTDVIAPFEALRNAIILLKGALSLPFTVADLNTDINNVMQFIKTSDLPELNNVLQKYADLLGDIGIGGGGFGGGGGFSLNSFGSNPSLSPKPTNGDDNNDNINLFLSNNIDDPNAILEILDQIDLENYQPNESEIENFNNNLDILANTTSDIVNDWINTLQDTIFLLENYFGAGDETVSRIYNLPPPKQRSQQMNIDEMLLLQDLYEALTSLYLLKSSNLIAKNDNKAFEIVSGLAEGTDYEFQSGKNNLAIKVPVPYGLTIEQIAQKYLGDYKRWIEIATLNNLNSPYIDEEGFIRPFLANGNGRNFNIADASNLYVGQTVFLLSDTVPKEARKILAIEKLSNTDYLITVDGLDNLHIFKVSDNARMHAFLPHTTNSTQTIWIPINKTDENSDLVIFSPPKIAQLDKFTGISKVDWMLGEDGDVVIDNFGDFKLSYGLRNLYQSLRLKIITPQGSRIVDPEYGMGVNFGINNAELSVNNLIQRLYYMIVSDDRYEAIESLEIDLSGPILKINAIVSLRDGLGSVPISVAINDNK